MGYMKVLGFSTLPCGCVVGRYLEMSAGRDLAYVEQKGTACCVPHHQKNRTIRPAALSSSQGRVGRVQDGAPQPHGLAPSALHRP